MHVDNSNATREPFWRAIHTLVLLSGRLRADVVNPVLVILLLPELRLSHSKAFALLYGVCKCEWERLWGQNAKRVRACKPDT